MKKLFLLLVIPLFLVGCSTDDDNDAFCWKCRFNNDLNDEDEDWQTSTRCDYTVDDIEKFKDDFLYLNPEGSIKCNKE